MTAKRAPRPSQPRCPECHVRYNVPRNDVGSSGPHNIPLDKYQLRDLYQLANEFIEASGGERLEVDDDCVTCGRWSLIAFLDWIAVDVKRQAIA